MTMVLMTSTKRTIIIYIINDNDDVEDGIINGDDDEINDDY